MAEDRMRAFRLSSWLREKNVTPPKFDSPVYSFRSLASAPTASEAGTQCPCWRCQSTPNYSSGLHESTNRLRPFSDAPSCLATVLCMVGIVSAPFSLLSASLVYRERGTAKAFVRSLLCQYSPLIRAAVQLWSGGRLCAIRFQRQMYY